MNRDRRQILIRADGGHAIGLGHLTRCMALAAALRRKGARATFVTRTSERKLLGKIAASGSAVVLMPPGVDHGDDARFLLRQAERLGAAAVVIDSYSITTAYQKAVKSAGLRLLCIDDVPRRDFVADIVLNQNPGVRAADYSARPYTRFLLGPRYALLRPSFPAARALPKRASARPRIVILMGGSDPRGLAVKTLRALDGLRLDFSMTVVAGAASRGLAGLSGAARGSAHPCRVAYDPKDLAGLMRRSALAVSAAGSTCWELACLGVPAVLMVLADNQQRIADGLHASGFALSLGAAAPFPARGLLDAVAALLRDPQRCARMARAGRRLIDGAGADRAAGALLR